MTDRAEYMRRWRAEHREQLNATQRARYRRRHEAILVQKRAWYRAHREQVLQRTAAYQRAHPEKRAVYQKRYDMSEKGKRRRKAQGKYSVSKKYWCSPKGRAARRRLLDRARVRALMFLGGRCEAPIRDLEGHVIGRCGWNDDRALQIDHIHGDGRRGAERKALGTRQYYKSILRQPERFQVLCSNHNWIKRCEQGEYNVPLERRR